MENKYEKWTGWFKECLRILQVSLFISRCRGCGADLVYRDENVICGQCELTIKMNPEPFCEICGRLMGDWRPRCGECMIAAPPFRKHASYSLYQGLLRELILAYKYGGIEKIKVLFAGYYTRLFQEQVNEAFDFIIPVPPDKGREREYCPVLQVSRILSRRLGIPLLPDQLKKIKQTEPQAGLSRAKRVKNLDGAFKLNQPEIVKDKKILLIDDVYTTGTTIAKCTGLLTNQQAEVVALTLARS
jgi:ComF family protein